MKNLKFKVHSPEHSEAIQKRLFELGYEWGTSKKTPTHLHAKYLFAHGVGHFLDEGSLGHDIDPIYYNEEGSEEATLDDLYNPEFIEEDDLKTKMKAKVKELQELLTQIK